MINAKHELTIERPILKVWDYVEDLQQWSRLFPGCKECEMIDRDNSLWTIKVGVGGLVRTVLVRVQVEKWSAPEQVTFSFTLDSEPVVGHGSYQAVDNGELTTVVLEVFVEGSGNMAPMWEAMCRPLLPQLAKTFANALKSEIEHVEQAPAPCKLCWWQQLWQRLRSLLRRPLHP